MQLTKALCALAALAIAAPSALAAGPCAPGEAAAAIDRYAGAPFSARTWRVLKGLGDPMIDPASPGVGDDWEQRGRFLETLAAVAPDVKLPASISYDCRIGYPAEVLEQRIAKLGRGHAYVKQWVRVQAGVIAACSGETVSELPPAMEAEGDVKALQEADRAYQQASLAFYADRPKSLDLFRAIGASGSPHKGAARYTVANILAHAKRLDEARAEARAILADPQLAGVHGITQELLGFIANLEDTAAGWSGLIDHTVAVLETPAQGILGFEKLKRDYARALADIDYAGIRAKADDWWLEGTLPENPTLSKAIVDAARKHAMVGWMIAGQTIEGYFRDLPWQLAEAKWREWTASLVRRTLALGPAMPAAARDSLEILAAAPSAASETEAWRKADAAVGSALESCGKSPETAAAGLLLEHAARLSAQSNNIDKLIDKLAEYPIKDSQAYRAAVLKLGRYFLGEGLAEQGRRYRDRLLTGPFWSGLPDSAETPWRDRFAELAMWLAEDRAHWEDALLRHSDRMGRPILNFLSVKELRALAKDNARFTPEERALFARVAWTRVFARGSKPEPSLTGELLALDPGARQIADKVKADYGREDWTLTVLRGPRFGLLLNAPADWQDVSMLDGLKPEEIDSWNKNDRNWWCPFETDRHLIALRKDFDAAAGQDLSEWLRRRADRVIDPSVLKELEAKREAVLKRHPVIRSVDWKEISALAAAPSGPKRLTRSAIAWAKSAKGDDGAAEALALAVRSTRYGCSWHGGHGAYSKAAHALLHKKYPETAWARQTPYWFDCTLQDGGAAAAEASAATCEPRSWPKQPLPR